MADLFEVLKRDHDEVRRMLAELHIGPTALTGATGHQLEARKRLTDQLIVAASRHEAVEEEFFWPVVRKQGPEAGQLADQAAGQELQVRQALAALTGLDTDAPEFEPLLTDVIAAGFEHLEFEEEQVWPLLRRAISPAQAADVGGAMASGRHAASGRGCLQVQPSRPPIQPSRPQIQPSRQPIQPSLAQIQPSRPHIQPSRAQISPSRPHIQPEEGSWQSRISS